MSISKGNKSGSQKDQGKRYPTSKLLKSKALAEYQPDFAKVILKKSEYSIQEAKDTLDAVLKGGR